MSLFGIWSLLIVLAGVFGAINYLFLRLPAAIGILVVALAASLGVIGIGALFPALAFSEHISRAIEEINFSAALLEGALGLLLFAGALHVKFDELRAQAWIVLLMATLGVALSTLIIGVASMWIFAMPPLIALIYGALISPTDPVAVLGVLRSANLPKSLEVKIAGESLFNDGVGYVLFLVLTGLAFSAAGHGDHAETGGQWAIIMLFLQEALGGAGLGAVLGFLTFQLMKRIDDFSLEVLLSLGLVLGGYQLALALHMSGPIFAVIAGLFIGDIGMKFGMSKETRQYVDAFWKLVDEILNAVLFLLIGFEIFVLRLDLGNVALIAPLAILLALFARFLAVAVPVLILRPFRSFSRGVIPIMSWGGLKGGISVALALSLPDNEWKAQILMMTYFVVLFSIIVQGLSIAPLARRIGREPELDM